MRANVAFEGRTQPACVCVAERIGRHCGRWRHAAEASGVVSHAKAMVVNHMGGILSDDM